MAVRIWVVPGETGTFDESFMPRASAAAPARSGRGDTNPALRAHAAAMVFRMLHGTWLLAVHSVIYMLSWAIALIATAPKRRQQTRWGDSHGITERSGSCLGHWNIIPGHSAHAAVGMAVIWG